MCQPRGQRAQLSAFGGRVSLRGEKKRLGGNVHPQNGDIGGCEASCVASEDYTIDQVCTLGADNENIDLFISLFSPDLILYSITNVSTH